MRQGSVHFKVEIHDQNAHLFGVTLTIACPAKSQRVSLPTWIPGSYLVREFSKNLQCLQANQASQRVAVTQIDKCTWEIACQSTTALILRYEIYAFDNSVRTAWLDTQRGFFNGTSLFLQVHGQEDSPHELALPSNKALSGWHIATGLTPRKTTKNGFGTYIAANYDELVDSPVEMGTFWSGTFESGGISHRFVVAGAPASFDGARLLADTKAICDAEIYFWHGKKAHSGSGIKPPHATYLFMLNAVSDGYGGLEHRNSTALICMRQDLPRLNPSELPASEIERSSPHRYRQPEGYTTLLGLISHEYFHTWNVKQLRPAEFNRYDYARENYTELLWFFEGFTSYYDDLLLRRAGLIDDATYLKLITKTINQVLQTPGRAVQTAAQASFDAWVKYYRQDENTPNATVSYYTKGALIAMCLDLTLRKEGSTTLDAVMRGLWLRCQGGPMTEADLAHVLMELSGRSFSKELNRWAHTTAELPLQPLLQAHGINVREEPAQMAQRLGIRVTEHAGIQIKTVFREGAAEQAGFAAGDEWIGIEVGTGTTTSQWRLSKLDDLLLYAGSAPKMNALIARDQRILTLSLTLPHAITTWRLVIRDQARLDQWLNIP
jgi:predicted metalloprotease with PDZ domain